MEPPSLIVSLQKQLETAGLAPPQDLKAYAEKNTAKVQIFYSSSDNKFHFPQSEGNFGTVPWQGFEAALRAVGVEIPKKDAHAAIEALRASIITKNGVDQVMPLAGHPIGLTKFKDGTRFLVTKDFKMVLPEKGDPAPLLSYLWDFLGRRPEQYDYVLSWLKIAVSDGLRCLKVGVEKARLRPSQLLAIVGPPGAGKTLFVTLFSELFGGTIQNPFPAMSGAADFQGELAHSVFLVMDDSAESVRADARHKLAKHIKEFLVVPNRRFHPKYRQAFSAPTFQRVLMLGNRDSLAVFPAPEPDFLDKYALLCAYSSQEVSAIRNDEERDAWMNRYKLALPAFVYYLLHEFQIPEAITDGRYGVKAFQDADLLEELSNSDTNRELLRCLREHYVEEDQPLVAGKMSVLGIEEDPQKERWCWEGYSKDFEVLVQSLPADQGWRREFRNRHSAGLLIKALADNYPDIVERGTKVNGNRRWRIYFEPKTKKGGPSKAEALKNYAAKKQTASQHVFQGKFQEIEED